MTPISTARLTGNLDLESEADSGGAMAVIVGCMGTAHFEQICHHCSAFKSSQSQKLVALAVSRRISVCAIQAKV
jgi:hypothetical protein